MCFIKEQNEAQWECTMRFRWRPSGWEEVLSPPYLLQPTLFCISSSAHSGSSFHGILQARILEWVAIPFCREFYLPKDGTWVSCIAGFFTICATSRKDGSVLNPALPYG